MQKKKAISPDGLNRFKGILKSMRKLLNPIFPKEDLVGGDGIDDIHDPGDNGETEEAKDIEDERNSLAVHDIINDTIDNEDDVNKNGE
jgi:hypothetical protein